MNDFPEKTENPEGPEIEIQDFRVYSGSSNVPLKTKIYFWLILAGGIAAGTVLFLFFITIFIYVFLPLAALFLIYQFLRRLLR